MFEKNGSGSSVCLKQKCKAKECLGLSRAEILKSELKKFRDIKKSIKKVCALKEKSENEEKNSENSLLQVISPFFEEKEGDKSNMQILSQILSPSKFF